METCIELSSVFSLFHSLLFIISPALLYSTNWYPPATASWGHSGNCLCHARTDHWSGTMPYIWQRKVTQRLTPHFSFLTTSRFFLLARHISYCTTTWKTEYSNICKTLFLKYCSAKNSKTHPPLQNVTEVHYFLKYDFT